MAGSYLDLARHELDRLNMEIEPLQETLNRLIETRDAWATIVRNAPAPTIVAEFQTEPVQDAAQRAAKPAASANGAESASERPEESLDDHGWKINAVREMFRTTYPRY